MAGIGDYVLVHRLDTVLARTDPFELAQALERYVRAMSPERIRSVVIDARDRIGAYYRTEFVALLAEFGAVDRAQPDALSSEDFVQAVREAGDGEALQGAFARLLRSNLRAIPLFGATFTQGVLDSVPSDRAVAIGEEPRNSRMRTIVLGGVAVALIFAGAAGEHVIATVRTQNALASPLPQVQSAELTAATPAPPVQQRSQTHAKSLSPSMRVVVTPAPAPPQPQVRPQRQEPTPPPQQPQPLAVPPPVAQPARTTAPRAKHTPPPAQGVATVALPDPTPTPEPSDLDVSDMPDVFTDATPLPSQSPPPAQVPSGVTLKTPAPPPKHKSWIKRTISHLNPFKP